MFNLDEVQSVNLFLLDHALAVVAKKSLLNFTVSLPSFSFLYRMKVTFINLSHILPTDYPVLKTF